MMLRDVRQTYLAFFSKKGHQVVTSSSLLPENDPTTLFTGSGMQPMIPYLLGQTHPLGRRIVDSQKCFRAQDVEEVGDNRHTTFFEMLGNWSLGDYFKNEQIPWMFQFLTDPEEGLGLDPAKLFVTVFRGDPSLGISRDEESVELWRETFASRGIDAKAVDFSERDGMGEGRIFYYDERKNWWSRSGVPSRMPIGEPGGPDTEMFWDFGAERGLHGQSAFRDQPCHVNCDCGRFMEIGNNVFMEYRKTEGGFERLAQRNVDFGGGLERFTAATLDEPDLFRIDVFRPMIELLQGLCGKVYGQHAGETKSFRIIADHIRAATFLIGDPQGVVPSNVGQGYVVRRWIRRAIREAYRLGITEPSIEKVATTVIDSYRDQYPELERSRSAILSELGKEEEKFGKALEKGLKELEKMSASSSVTGAQAFTLFSTYGFPWELSEEILREKGTTIDREMFEAEFKNHQELSRTASAGMFKGGLADHSLETTRLHTATHLLHQALRTVLGEHVFQRGSNITSERLRFDFSHPQKVTEQELAQVEDLVNGVIVRDLPVTIEEMTVDEAKSKGVIGVFEDKYAQMGGKIKVYFIGDFSKEICGGPHVTHTGELGSFKIVKEEAVSAGVRRIKAVIGG